MKKKQALHAASALAKPMKRAIMKLESAPPRRKQKGSDTAMKLTQNFRDNVTGIQHLGIPTRDLEATVAFYQGLGFETVWANGEVAFLQLGTLVIETYASEEVALRNGAIDHVALNVRDIETAWRDVQAGGYEVADAEINFLPFFENGVKFFTIIGPNREKVEFNQFL